MNQRQSGSCFSIKKAIINLAKDHFQVTRNSSASTQTHMLVQTQQLDTVFYEAVSLPPACKEGKGRIQSSLEMPSLGSPWTELPPQLGRSVADGRS